MSNRFTCALDGVSLDGVCPGLRVTDVTELSPRMRTVTQPSAGHGLRLLRRVRESLTVRVNFLIPEYDPAKRRDALTQVSRWAARGGYLTTSERPGQRLRIDYCTVPVMSALGWSDEVDLEMTALASPFWETETEYAASTAAASSLKLPGFGVDCPVSCDVYNNGEGPLTRVALTCGGTQMTFEGLSLQPGEFLQISAGSDGVLTATAGDASVLMHRTAGSHDLLLAAAGGATDVAVEADQAVRAVFRARGRYA